jgi:hypothetical protein
MYTIDLDLDSGILNVVHTGFMSEAVYTRYHADFGQHVVRLRRLGIPLRLLADGTAMEILPPEVAGRIDEMKNFLGKGDRIALVVQSSLLKMQIRRIASAPPEAFQLFLSLNAARTWLMAHENQAAA